MIKLPDTELKIMEVIWHMETPISTVDIKDELQKERPWNLSPLQTLLGRLVKKGFLKTEKIGKNRFYSPLIEEREYMAEDSKKYFEKWKGGSLKNLVACLYENDSITKNDLEELKEYIEKEVEQNG